ncbi:hypothetical protein R4K52_05175 [Brachyspira pilosicoli]|uniref:hypothetical protein n=1 Tax=Brachyspira pilosicoli TaxID=52584 RepID=UPI00300565E2
MNNEMSYLLGMIYGNSDIKRTINDTTIIINIPHKKLKTDDFDNIKLYVKASISDIRNIIEPLIGSGIKFIQRDISTEIYFTKSNNDYVIREIMRYIDNNISSLYMRCHKDIFNFSIDEKKQFLKGFADVTGYVRRSNYYFQKYMHRVYIEIPNNWDMVVDICNLLKDIDVPVQTIDWAHPNMRDPKLKKYDGGNKLFWKKEHQIKIWVNEFLPIGFGVIHKNEALLTYSNELISGIKNKNVNSITHKYYWDNKKVKSKIKLHHPEENNEFIHPAIRGKHFNSWNEIARDLGYVK